MSVAKLNGHLDPIYVDSMSDAEPTGLFVKLGDREIEINLELYRVVQDYIKNSYTLDVLADKLGLDGWAEAYQFMSSLPQWVFWFTESQLEEYLNASRGRGQTVAPPKRGGRKRREQADAQQAEDKQQKVEDQSEKQPPTSNTESSKPAGNTTT